MNLEISAAVVEYYQFATICDTLAPLIGKRSDIACRFISVLRRSLIPICNVNYIATAYEFQYCFSYLIEAMHDKT